MNSQFGLKRISARLDLDGCVAEPKVTFKMFYPLTATNHPQLGLRALDEEYPYPNWFYYYKQTPAGKPAGGPPVEIYYGGRTWGCYDKNLGFLCGWYNRIYFGIRAFVICDLSANGASDLRLTYFRVNWNKDPDGNIWWNYLGKGTLTYIDSFASAVIHEYQHLLNEKKFWTDRNKSDGDRAEEDKDKDGIPDEDEAKLGFDKGKIQTWSQEHPEVPAQCDEDWLCYEAQTKYTPGQYKNHDWAHPGSQWP